MFRYLAKLMTSIVFILTSIGVMIIFIFFYYGRGLPEYDYLRHYQPPSLTRLYTANYAVFQEYATERRVTVPLQMIPPLLVKAFLVAEDKSFYYHFGIDIPGMVRAAALNTVTKNWQSRPGGGSTITQQVAKNFLIGNERSMTRKLREAIMSIRLESALSKDRILELYLNEIYLGSRSYGVAAAALTYFNKPLESLTIAEMAFLAALPKAPSTYVMQKDLSKVKIRRDWVIDRMVAEGVIHRNVGDFSKAQPIQLTPACGQKMAVQYYSEEVKREVVRRFGAKEFQQGGLSVFTSYDARLQKIADNSLRRGLIQYDRRHGWRGPITHIPLESMDWARGMVPMVDVNGQNIPYWLSAIRSVAAQKGAGDWQTAIVLHAAPNQAVIGFADGHIGLLPLVHMMWARPCLMHQWVGVAPKSTGDVVRVGDVVFVSQHEEKDEYCLEQMPKVTGAIVVMEPKTGRVLALSGGYSYERSQFNCATQAYRQPGSAFKPFVYLTALERGYTSDSMILDAPLSVSLGNGRGFYVPQNYSRRFYGPSPLRLGIEQSRNVMTVRLAQRLGMRHIGKTALNFNVMDRMPNQLAMALGAGETTVLRLTAAYAMIANGGMKIEPTFVDAIQNRQGKTIYTRPAQTRLAPLVSTQSIAEMTAMLEGVITRGTAQRLMVLGRPVAGKTGTTNDYKDAWFVGFTRELVVGVFVGFPSPQTLGSGETGGHVAVPIFENFMSHALVDQQPAPLLQGAVLEEVIYPQA